MKRLISWMLVLCMALSLMPAGLAEEFFAEESFFDAPTGDDENLFFEEGFFGDDSFFAVDGEEAADAAEGEDDLEFGELETRSIVSFVTDEVVDYGDVDPITEEDLLTDAQVADLSNEEYADYEAPILAWTINGYWKEKPLLWVESDESAEKDSDTIFLSWVQFVDQTDIFDVTGTQIIGSFPGMGVVFQKTAVDKASGETIPVRDKKTGRVTAKTIGRPTAMPKDVKYYVYAVNEDTGASYQVGKAIAAKPIKEGKIVIGFGNSVTLKKMDGDFTYFVRAEKNVAQKATKLNVEEYGISSDRVSARAASLDWRKKVTKITLAQQGDRIVVSWANAYRKLNAYHVQVYKNGQKLTDADSEHTIYLEEDGSIDPEGSDDISSSGTTYTLRWKLPLPYASTDQFQFEITPMKKIGSELISGTPAMSGKIKPLDPWKTLAAFTAVESEEENPAPAEYALVDLSWKFPATALLEKDADGDYTVYNGAYMTYSLSGLLFNGEIMVALMEDGETPTWKDTTKTKVKDPNKTPIYTEVIDGDTPYEKLEAELITSTSGDMVQVTATVKAKVAANAKITVAPARFTKQANGKFKKEAGNKATATVDLKNFYMAQPVITSGMQIDANKVQLTFIHGEALREGEGFVVSGFNGNTEFKWAGGAFSNVATKNPSDATISGAANEDGEMEFTVIGTVKEVKKNSTVKFTVQPKFTWEVNGKMKSKTGVKSAAYAVTVMPSATAAAMNIYLDDVDNGGSTKVHFTELPPVDLNPAVGTAIKSIAVSLVCPEIAYAEKYVIYREMVNGQPGAYVVADKDGKPESFTERVDFEWADNDNERWAHFWVKFDDIDPDEKYTVFVETYLLSYDKKAGKWVDGGRTIDTVTSISAGAKPIDSDLTQKPKVDGLQSWIASGIQEAGYKYVEGDDKTDVLLGEKISLNLGTLILRQDGSAYPSDVKWGYKVGGKVVSKNESTIDLPLAEGKNEVSFRVEKGDDVGVWSDPVTIFAYKPVTATLTGPAEAWNEVKLNAAYAGGSRTYNATITATYTYTVDEEVKTKTTDPEVMTNTTYTGIIPAEADYDKNVTYTLTVEDKHIQDKQGHFINDIKTASVKKIKDKASGAFKFAVRSDDEVMVTGYVPGSYQAETKSLVTKYNNKKPVRESISGTPEKPIVPGWVTLEGKLYQVTGIGDSAFTSDAVTAELSGVYLPNEIDTIGISAFSGCSGLSSMECYYAIEDQPKN